MSNGEIGSETIIKDYIISDPPLKEEIHILYYSNDSQFSDKSKKNGNIWFYKKFHNIQRDGIWKHYENGIVVSEGTYKNGELIEPKKH
jgi:antitoxin component YwqK of YwqJK toxin-antitoxin module